MELKLSVSIGATLQVKNAKGEWDWIKPEVGCELKLADGEIDAQALQDRFTTIWDDVVGPQFRSVVLELTSEQVTVEGVDATETVDDSLEVDEY